ncbi:MAG TPA: HD domain-containing phosphohydrolase [Solirubrobacteraceae bacterium]|jgi:ribonuclease P protein subunit RPR2|nr:HD domain-containing phosphohydrolase [Solirubrobacteraceae bacterium]
MAQQTVDELARELERLREQLAEHEQAATLQKEQLERYAADLRETFKQERARSVQLADSAKQLQESYMATVRALSNAVEARDAYTGKHAERVAAYGLEIARATGGTLASDPQIEFGFLLHDVGKVAVPDAILYKPEPLSHEERMLMERHPVTGFEILSDIDFLGAAKDVVRSHHERWDGNGYPDGLAGEEIPFAARVFAAADTLDALTSSRPYRPAMGMDDARKIIAAGSGSQFDPDVVAAFNVVPDEVFERLSREIA